MRIFKNAWFARFARKEGVADAVLLETVSRICRGHIDADLGGGVLKQRIGREGAGKSSGYRSIVLFRKDHIALFVYGFAKNSLENICESELMQFKKMARHVLNLSNEQIVTLLKNGQLEEVINNEQAI